MSVLSQFFGGGGGGGGGIPTQVLVVGGGHGLSCGCMSQSGPSGPAAAYLWLQGRGGYVDVLYCHIAPETTCSITVGSGGSDLYRCAGYLVNICPYQGIFQTYSCCFGGSGGASKFGDFGGIDRPQPTQTCGSCPYALDPVFIKTPYKAIYPSRTDIRLDTCGIISGSCVAAGSPSPCFIHMTGFNGGTSSNQCCQINCPNIDSRPHQGYVSRITGTTQTYGASKIFGLCSTGLNNCFINLNREHPNSIGPGSGHGAYWCGTCAGTSREVAAPGTVVIQYPDDYDAATTSSPNVCDCSPDTPGFRTYRFLCPGSITFP